MAKIRGVKNAMPVRGDSPTGIFSTRGKQKLDPLAGDQSKFSKMTGANGKMARMDPVTRDNRIKG